MNEKIIKIIFSKEDFEIIYDFFKNENFSCFIPSEIRDLTGSGFIRYLVVMNNKMASENSDYIELEVSKTDLKYIVKVLEFEANNSNSFSWKYEILELKNHVENFFNQFKNKYISQNF